MARQYNRSYTLSIGTEGTGIEITELRVRFEISKDLQGFPNLAKIEIFNLNEQSRAQIKDEFEKVIFNAGYEGNTKQIFIGDIRNVTHTRQGVDIITTIFAADGDKDFRESYTNTTLADGAKLEDIVGQIASSFEEVTIGTLDGLDSAKEKLRGAVMSGSSKDLLDKFSGDYGFDWSIQDGVFETVGKDASFDNVTVITSQTGMIDSPAITEIGADVKILLNPEILPNRLIQIESATPQIQLGNLFFRDIKKTLGEGQYKVQKVVHIGDTHSNDWFSNITGRSL